MSDLQFIAMMEFVQMVGGGFMFFAVCYCAKLLRCIRAMLKNVEIRIQAPE